MVVLFKWFLGGKGFDEFCVVMFVDCCLCWLVDYLDLWDVFIGVDVVGGVNYFFWNCDDLGVCIVEMCILGGKVVVECKLDEFEVFICDNWVLKIVNKVCVFEELVLLMIVLVRWFFGIDLVEWGIMMGDFYLYVSGWD